jgi:hypothetical protein
MKPPRYTDKQRGGRYRTADETKQPGYLARRLKAYARLERMRAGKSNVTAMKPRRKAA